MRRPRGREHLGGVKVLVACASRHGSTTEIGHAIAERLGARGFEVVEATPDGVGIGDADAVVIGSAVYAGRWLSAARAFVRANMSELRQRPVWLFSSGPVGDPPLPADEPREADELVELVHARGHRTLTGRIDPAGLKLAERAVVRLLGASTDDARDWDAVAAYADEIADQLTRDGSGA